MQNAPSKILDRVLNTPLNVYSLVHNRRPTRQLSLQIFWPFWPVILLRLQYFQSPCDIVLIFQARKARFQRRSQGLCKYLRWRAFQQQLRTFSGSLCLQTLHFQYLLVFRLRLLVCGNEIKLLFHVGNCSIDFSLLVNDCKVFFKIKHCFQ